MSQHSNNTPSKPSLTPSQPAAASTPVPKPAAASSKPDGDEDDDSGLSSSIQNLSLGSTPPKSVPAPVLPSFTLSSVAELIRSGRARRIIVLTGAGISVSSGIPDFRTPGTGLYSNLQRFNLPDPQAMFTLSYFRRNPEPFVMLAREMYPTLFTPSPTHHFITLLHEKGVLLRAYTQNIDGLEYLANLPQSKLVQAHGGFHLSHCIDCDATVSAEENKADIMAGRVTRCKQCGGLVKPRIVFFGESLPHAFHAGIHEDFPKCDLLICMGTSLTVQPFASLIDRVPATTPRVLINREAVGKADVIDSDDEEQEQGLLAQLLASLKAIPTPSMIQSLKNRIRLMTQSSGFQYHSRNNTRDVFVQADCDAGVRMLADLLGWKEELEENVRRGYRGGRLREGEAVQGDEGKVEVEKREAAQEKEEEREVDKEGMAGETNDQEAPAREEAKPNVKGHAADTAKL